MSNLAQQIEFILELDNLKTVKRMTVVKGDGNRQENSAEHSWHIALVAQSFAEYAKPSVDLNRVIAMLLIHDVVEIDAGDMFAFAQQENHAEQEQKEIAAAERLFGLLPEHQGEKLKALWFEFEAAETDDAQFAKGMDRILPVFQNMSNGGGSWLKHSVSKSQVVQRNLFLKISAPELWQYVLEQIDLAVEKGWLTDL